MKNAIPALVGAIKIDSAEQALVKYESKALGPVFRIAKKSGRMDAAHRRCK
jgi:hypothetical protein